MIGTDAVVAMVSDTWADSVRRGFYSTADQTILSLLGDERIRRVMVADHPRGLPSKLKALYSGAAKAPHTAFFRSVRPAVLSTPVPASVAAIERRYRMYDRQLAFGAVRHRLQSPALVTFNIYHAAYGDHRWAESVCFYAQDDESAIPYKAAQVPLLKEAYKQISKSGMDVYAVSDVLLDRIAPTGRGFVIPNGVDSELWGLSLRSGRSDTRTPVAAYAGTIDGRIDVTAVAKLAASGIAVRMAGVIADAKVGTLLSEIPGVELVGSIARSEVAAFLMSADVCFMAHRRTPLTEAMSPLKIYEYLASGNPVVATNLGSFGAEPLVGASCILVDPGGDYVGAVNLALERGQLSEPDRQKLVQSLSWRARHEPLIQRLTGAVS
ncbi:glycosyltransferase [Bacillus cereus]|uniref:glycosyltransferase n=1 Tax=Bacillus cereus TaxID=1396 RepID=UPI00366A0163